MARFSVDIKSTPNENIIVDGCFRFSVLSDRVLRIEHDNDGLFDDLPSATVICRNFAKPTFTYAKSGDKVSIATKIQVFVYDESTDKIWVEKDGVKSVPNARDNLCGTARTLDGTLGLVNVDTSDRKRKDVFFFPHIRKGLFAKNGVTTYEDGAGVLLCEDGSIKPRREGVKDTYVFAFGNDFEGGLKEFYSLTGFTPLLPKYVLGNWWSRYHAYTQEEYTSLMGEFENRDIPFTVATIDMDWHIVKNTPKDAKAKSFQGAGWTGYTFEKELFPDHKKFFSDLKAKGLAITMNLHPRDGVRYFEEQYADMCKAMGVDASTKQPIEFDLTNATFRDAYFDILHHPYEDEGVDFWWIDWQQGTKSKMAGVDPLWLLNHYHTMDINRNKKEGEPSSVVLSRYAGLGSHRFPIGFSGDSVVCWKSLQLQPWFTATASNVGYTWWSHDIGGHMFGKGDNELYLRWVQFGVFSPINRLHSNTRAMSKEPWNYPHAEKTAVDFLRLRHRLLPYLYTANVLTAKEGVPLIEPMYYAEDSDSAYLARNQYRFGSELVVAPVVTKGKLDKQRGKVVSNTEVYLPKGAWTDFFTGEKYEGGRWYLVKSELTSIPVFAKAGAIIPLIAERKGNSQKFDELEVRVYDGENEYVAYDEVGSIAFKLARDGGGCKLDIKPSADCQTETLRVVFVDAEKGSVCVDGKSVGCGKEVTVKLKK